MAQKCGKCESENLGASEQDLWHYMRYCNDCGARTRYSSRGKVVWVKGGEEKPKKNENSLFKSDLSRKEYISPINITGKFESFGGNRFIQDTNGNRINSIDQFGNVKDSSGYINGHLDSFGNIKDNNGNINGYIDSFGNIHKK